MTYDTTRLYSSIVLQVSNDSLRQQRKLTDCEEFLKKHSPTTPPTSGPVTIEPLLFYSFSFSDNDLRYFCSYLHREEKESVYQNEIVIAAISCFIFGAFLAGIGITLIILNKNKNQPQMELKELTQPLERR